MQFTIEKFDVLQFTGNTSPARMGTVRQNHYRDKTVLKTLENDLRVRIARGQVLAS